MPLRLPLLLCICDVPPCPVHPPTPAGSWCPRGHTSLTTWPSCSVLWRQRSEGCVRGGVGAHVCAHAARRGSKGRCAYATAFKRLHIAHSALEGGGAGFGGRTPAPFLTSLVFQESPMARAVEVGVGAKCLYHFHPCSIVCWRCCWRFFFPLPVWGGHQRRGTGRAALIVLPHWSGSKQLMLPSAHASRFEGICDAYGCP